MNVADSGVKSLLRVLTNAPRDTNLPTARQTESTSPHLESDIAMFTFSPAFLSITQNDAARFTCRDALGRIVSIAKKVSLTAMTLFAGECAGCSE